MPALVHDISVTKQAFQFVTPIGNGFRELARGVGGSGGERVGRYRQIALMQLKLAYHLLSDLSEPDHGNLTVVPGLARGARALYKLPRTTVNGAPTVGALCRSAPCEQVAPLIHATKAHPPN
jgi:hypothetical protein